MRTQLHIALATVLLAFIAAHAIAVSGSAIPFSARNTDHRAQRARSVIKTEPATYSSLDRRVFDFGASGGDLFDVVSQVLTKPRDSAQGSISAIAHSPTPSPQPSPPRAELHQIAANAQSSGRLRQLERPSWMNSQIRFGLTPHRLALLQSDDRGHTEELIGLLNRSVKSAYRYMLAAEAKGSQDEKIAWRTKHNADCAIRDAALARLNDIDVVSAERMAEAKFDELQASSIPMHQKRFDRRIHPAFVKSKALKGGSQIKKDVAGPPIRWYNRDKDKMLSKSPFASAKDAEEVMSNDPPTRVAARRRIKRQEARWMQSQEASRAMAKPRQAEGSSGTSALHHESTDAASRSTYHSIDRIQDTEVDSSRGLPSTFY